MQSHIFLTLINISSLILGSAILLVYLRRRPNPNYLFLLLVLSVMPLASLLRPGSFESGDMTLNAYKTLSYLQAIKDGIFPPIWAGKLNGLYGYPLFLFTYPLPYFLGALISLVGIPIVISIKIIMAFAFIASGFAMYYLLQQILTKENAFCGSVIYLYTPYHLIDLHFRATLGELFAFIFLPLSFSFLLLFQKKQTPLYFFLVSLSVSLLTFSHQAISLISLVLLGSYVLSFGILKTYKVMLLSSLSLLTGLLLAAFYWLPVITEVQYTHQPFYAQTIEYAGIKDLLYSPYLFGILFQGHYGELSHLIGYTQLLIIIGSIYLLLLGKIPKVYRNYTLAILLALFITLFFITPYSAPFWRFLPLIKNFQFSWRLLVFVCFFVSVLAGFVLSQIKNQKLFILFMGVTITYTVLNWGNRGTVTLSDSQLERTLPESSAKGEGLAPAIPKWTDPAAPFMKDRWQQPLLIRTGKGLITVLFHLTNYHSYQVIMRSNGTLQENTLYFPGWEIRIDGNAVPITPLKTYPKGVMVFSVPKGIHRIEISFNDTPIRYYSKLISLFTLLFSGVFLLLINFIKIFPRVSYTGSRRNPRSSP